MFPIACAAAEPGLSPTCYRIATRCVRGSFLNLARLQQRIDLPRRISLQVRHNVSVSAHRYRDVGVTGALAGDLGVHFQRQQMRQMGVTQIMQSHSEFELSC